MINNQMRFITEQWINIDLGFESIKTHNLFRHLKNFVEDKLSPKLSFIVTIFPCPSRYLSLFIWVN